MNVLILGKGYIGSYLEKYLKTCSSKLKDVRIVSRDLCDYSTVAGLHDLMEQKWVDFIINCSGYTGKPNVDACEDAKDLCWDLNVTVPSRIAQVCLDNNIPFGQVSSGCIYTGYEKEYSETDIPNFGLYNNESSFYSKSKHAGELALADKNAYIWRIRMPFCNTWSPKNILTKIYKYDKLISMPNSLTNVNDLCKYIYKFIEREYTKERLPAGIYNVVNEGSLNARSIVEMMTDHCIKNPNWQFINYNELDIRANRSNCVLSQDKNKQYGIDLPDARESVNKALQEMSKITI